MATAITIPISPRGYSLKPNELVVPVEEYLRTSYRPDMDYVDGHLEERNRGDWDHGDMQGALLQFLRNHAREWSVFAVPECRMQVAANRYRIPDIIVVARDEKPDRIVRSAPLLCIEVLSPDDTFRRMQSRIDDYVAMGVKNIWVLDPKDGRVFTVSDGHQQFTEEKVLTVPGTAIRIDLDEITRELAQ